MNLDPSIVCWLRAAEILYFHDLTIRQNGGLPGFQKGGKERLESTLIRPLNLLLYEPDATLPDLAATLIYGFAKNHCFNEGNKRVSAISGALFLEANGIQWRPHDDDLVRKILAITASAPADQENQISNLAGWIKCSILASS